MENKSQQARMALNCAADSMETLRKCDVERVMQTARRNGSFEEVAAWVQSERPDLAIEIQKAEEE